MEKNIIFGLHPVMEAIESGRQIEKVYIKKGAEREVPAKLKDLCREYNINLQEVPVEKLNHLTRGNHQGVVAKIAEIEYAELDDIMTAIPEGEVPLIVMLDGITDVRNFGAIARSAECAGAHGIIVPIKNGAPVNADAMKSSAGALNIIPVCRVGSLRNTLKILQIEGMQAVAATEKGDTSIFQSDMKKPTVIIMGSEDKGVSKELLKMCDSKVSIPMVGHIESLNVSAAAAVILFETVRQRRSM